MVPLCYLLFEGQMVSLTGLFRLKLEANLNVEIGGYKKLLTSVTATSRSLTNSESCFAWGFRHE